MEIKFKQDPEVILRIVCFVLSFIFLLEGVREYRCSYRDCGYTAAQKNHFLQHMAFTHDEWYKRINRRIEEAVRDPRIAEELEDLSAIKEAFVTDYR